MVLCTLEELLLAKEKIKKGLADENWNTCLRTVNQLTSYDVTTRLIKESGIGRYANKLKKVSNETVANRARGLVHKWKSQLEREAAQKRSLKSLADGDEDDDDQESARKRTKYDEEERKSLKRLQSTEVIKGAVPTLSKLSLAVVLRNKTKVGDLTGMPLDFLRPFFRSLNVVHLKRLEHINPDITDFTDVYWKTHCKPPIPATIPKVGWRAFYERQIQAREEKLNKSVRNLHKANELSNQAKSHIKVLEEGNATDNSGRVADMKRPVGSFRAAGKVGPSPWRNVSRNSTEQRNGGMRAAIRKLKRGGRRP